MPESRRALAAMAQIDAETGAVKALDWGIRNLESMLPSLDAAMDDLAVYPLSSFTPPFRDESPHRDEARLSRPDNAPMSLAPLSTRPSGKGFPGSSRRSTARSGGGTSFSIDRDVPVGPTEGVFEKRAGVGSFSSIRPASPANGKGMDPLARESHPPAGAADALSAEKRTFAGHITSEGMETLLQLVEIIEGKGGVVRETRRAGNVQTGKASHSSTAASMGPQRRLRPLEHFDFSSHRPSRAESWVPAESANKERAAQHRVGPSTQHPINVDGSVPPSASAPFDPAEIDDPIKERVGRTGDQRNDMENADHPWNSPMSTPGPNAPRTPAAVQRFTGKGEFADAGEQLADLINAALQAQARRRGLS